MADGSIHDVAIGAKAHFSKTVAESDVYLFAGITGDLDRNHVDEEYCRTTPLGRRVAHGALIVGFMSTASTLVLPDFPAPLVAVGFDRVRFTRPVFIGDTVTVEYEITGKDVERSRTVARVEVTNQRGEVVAVATHIMAVLS